MDTKIGTARIVKCAEKAVSREQPEFQLLGCVCKELSDYRKLRGVPPGGDGKQFTLIGYRSAADFLRKTTAKCRRNQLDEFELKQLACLFSQAAEIAERNEQKEPFCAASVGLAIIAEFDPDLLQWDAVKWWHKAEALTRISGFARLLLIKALANWYEQIDHPGLALHYQKKLTNILWKTLD